MNTLQTLALCVCTFIAASGAEPQIKGGYLPPPQTGYNYNPPSVPFPPPSSPSPSTYYPPPPSYKPSTPRPIYTPRPSPPPPPPSSYLPPRPTYNPPPPSYSTPRPFTTPAPTYKPRPTPTYQPPTYLPPDSGSAISPDFGTGGGEFDHLAKPHVPGMPFDFNYAVKDDYYGNDYSHNAISDGDIVRGEYKTLLPDGRLQVVKYVASWKDGYTAEVTYEGEAKYPAQPQPGTSGGSIGAEGQYPSGGYPSAPKPYPTLTYPSPQPVAPLKPSYTGQQSVIGGYPGPAPTYTALPSPQPTSGYPSESAGYSRPSSGGYSSPSPSASGGYSYSSPSPSAGGYSYSSPAPSGYSSDYGSY